MATAFAILVTIVIVGWLWFYIARPILEDYGVLAPAESVKTSQDSAANVMSRSQDETPQEVPSSHRQTALQTDRQPAQQPIPTISRDVMLNTYRLLRKYGVPREEARPVLKAANIPLDNNLWTQAAPPAEKPEEYRTPIADRPTRASYYDDDPDLAYQSPPS
jgi:hypothetical protein